MPDRRSIWASQRPATSNVGGARWPLLALLGVIGALHAVWLVGVVLWSPGAALWETPPNDIATGLVGMEALLGDAWHWPLTLTNRLLVDGEPISIAYTDSLPLLAIVLKAIGAKASMLAPFGIAILLGQVLQPIAAGWALQRAGLSRWIILIPGAILLACAPSWLFRLLVQHVTLTWHWPVLLALGLSLGWCRSGRVTRGEIAGAIALCFVAIGTHPYLALEVGAVLLSGCLVLMGEKRPLAKRLIAAATLGGGMVASVVFGAIASGFWPPPKPGLTIGPYMGKPGHHSANLLGPFDFSYSALWTGSKPIDATTGQYEGMTYAGAGVLFLVALVVVIAAARLLSSTLRTALHSFDSSEVPALGRFWPVITMASALAFVALSPTVWLGNDRLFSLPIPEVLTPFFDQFRSNGRFIWPGMYLAIILLIVALVRCVGLRRGSIAVTVALGLQVADSAILRQGIRDMVARSAMEVPSELAAVTESGALKGNVRLRPSWGCLRIPDFLPDRLIALRVIRSGGIVHEPPIARGGTSDCNAALIATDRAISGVADVVFRYSLSLQNQITLIARRNCNAFETLIVCRDERNSGALALKDVLALLPPDERVQAGVRYPIIPGQLGVEWLSEGWSVPEAWGTWSDGPSAVLLLPIPMQQSVRAVRLELTAFSSSPMQRQPLSVTIGERMAWEGELVAFQVRTIPIAVDRQALGSNFVVLTLHIGRPQSPSSAGAGSDTRMLGVGLLSIEWE